MWRADKKMFLDLELSTVSVFPYRLVTSVCHLCSIAYPLFLWSPLRLEKSSCWKKNYWDETYDPFATSPPFRPSLHHHLFSSSLFAIFVGNESMSRFFVSYSRSFDRFSGSLGRVGGHCVAHFFQFVELN